jgi:outer membrane receptor protein involved in Fe transport
VSVPGGVDVCTVLEQGRGDLETMIQACPGKSGIEHLLGGRDPSSDYSLACDVGSGLPVQGCLPLPERDFSAPVQSSDRPRWHTKTNLNLEYGDQTGRYKVDAYVDNLENKVVRNGAFSVLGQYRRDYNPPRTYGVRVSFKY